MTDPVIDDDTYLDLLVKSARYNIYDSDVVAAVWGPSLTNSSTTSTGAGWPRF